MLEYARIDLSKGIGVNKTTSSHESAICYCWYFLEITSRFQLKVCNGCHNIIQKATSFNNAAIIPAK